MRLESYGLSHIGYVRKVNDDCFAELLSHGFFVLADGIGSLSGGGQAAKMAVRYLLDEVKKNPLFTNSKAPLESLLLAVENALASAHRMLWQYGVEKGQPGSFGTTIVCLFFTPTHCLFAYVGDSRIYRLRSGQLELLSHDDSLVFDLLHYGLIEESEARTFPLKHIITRSLGGQNSLTTHCESRPLQKGDLFLLCSDGLSGLVEESQLRRIMLNSLPLPQMAEALQKTALEAGGFDNISLIVCRVE